MATQTSLPFTFPEGTSAEISWAFQDAGDVAVQNAALETATITLYDVESDSIINSRDGQDILGLDKSGTNNVAITSGGVATWYVQPDDNPMIGTAEIEEHIALVEWTWDPDDGHGIRAGKFEIVIRVDNLHRVP